MDHKKTGRDRGDGATRMGLLQQIHADFPRNCASVQRARRVAAMREAGRDPHRQARYVGLQNQGGAALFDALAYLALGAWAGKVALWLLEML